MSVSEEQIQQVTEQIWSSMLELHPCPIAVESGPGQQEPGIGASVQITGGWEGAVRIDSSMSLARMAAARFVGSEPEQVSIEQIRDAIGELANMSAGMIKNLLPGPSYLSLPSVADGSEYNFTIRGSNLESQAQFHCEGEPLAVSLLRRKYLAK
ncbi:MAG TPA: chemotaxis protein CheX [Terriglobales bacterium]|nr:chemotaxis protein CheX [Terriglobales bacterium]